MKNALLTSPSGPNSLGRLDAAALMRGRLQGKIENLEREARRLAFRGEQDAAHALERAAWKLKVIVKRAPERLAV